MIPGHPFPGAGPAALRACCALLALALPNPLAAQNLEATLLPADPMPAQLFGHSVSLQGDLAVVGASGTSGNAGAAYVFRRADGVWAQELKLEPLDLEATDLFGASTVLDGDLIAVGAPDALDVFGGGNPGAGAVYLFRDTGGTWPQHAKLMASDAANFDQLGRAVAAQGALLVAGAPGDLPTGEGALDGGFGAAYVFRFDGLAWTQEAKLAAAHGFDGDMLGQAVALDGARIVVGVPGDDGTGSAAGAALVFQFANGAWVPDARLSASDGAAGDQFGAAVAVHGDLIAVGAPFENTGGSDTGAIYLYEHDGLAWVEVAKLVASDPAAQSQLGASLSLQPPVLLAGAPGASAGDGKGYLFVDDGLGWVEHSQLAQGASSFCGRGVSIDGTTVLLGAPWTPNGPLFFAGQTYVFEAFFDCNGNALPDDTDIAIGGSPDCNGNLVPDECDLASLLSADCDENGIPDECDPDLNENDIPDACEGTWTDLGFALPGLVGPPVLAGVGTLQPHTPVTITLSNAVPDSQTALFIGLSPLMAPFKGGVFVPHPTIAILGLPTGPAGVLPLNANWPVGLPPAFPIYFQHWIVDPAGPAGLSSSNGLSATTPP